MESAALQVHRCRFVPFKPEPINAIACNTNGLIALGRGSGNIDIYSQDSDKATPIFIKTLTARAGQTVESLLWVGPNELLAVGLGSFISHYNVRLGLVAHDYDSLGGAVWTVAGNADASAVVTGCEDCSLKMFRRDGVDTAYSFALASDRFDGRVLCASFSPDGEVICAGDAAGYARVLPVRTLRTRQRLMVSPATSKSNADILWDCVFINNQIVALATSSGRVELWNTVVGLKLSSYETHMADVLCLAHDPISHRLLASGIDAKLVVLEPAPAEISAKPYEYVVARQRRYHSHDVRCLTVSKGKIYSAGIDGSVGILSAAGTGKISTISPYPQHKMLCHASKARVLLSLDGPQRLTLWNLQGNAPEIALSVEMEDAVSAFAVAPDASQIAVAAGRKLKLFAINLQGKRTCHKVKTWNYDAPVCSIKFGANGALLLALTSDLNLTVMTGADFADVQQLELGESVYAEGTGRERPAAAGHVHLSNDAQYAVLVHGRYGHVVQLDTIKYTNTFDAGTIITACTFLYQTHDCVCIGADATVVAFNVERSLAKSALAPKLSAAGKECKALLKAPVFDIVCHPAGKALYFVSNNGVASLILGKAGNASGQPEAKRRRPLLVKRLPYQPVLHFGFSRGEILVVEKPWLDVLQLLPEPLSRSRYGTA
ncbi:uncharacterized protein MONBRDRAFT_35702 [Monosiga brevicollis MX1]|uniref:Anaphase-promoting complex subunit 4 WD40 domain-containing protein n=1 Tax=Monosiga brevicollis TaxID=81824 RepID=A9UQU3_MONBE|nr:uncharacterized protein MONBRDRAFT_35702 [Monosiga brevicollis MX1]EDQ93105.1 predicted protein [Monosiga brevicollis MX1]|eukprot:XP_001742867.1 hypothetical protein [Monosiga brevicollis MX1]